MQMKKAAEDTNFSEVRHFDVILDYCMAPSTAHVLGSLKTAAGVQFVQI